MEEVDKTLLHIIRGTGCSLDNISSIGEFSTREIVAACSHLLHAIDAKYKFPATVPKGSAMRFRICTNISQAIADLGYTGENGYQAFLYPNETDMRKLLTWLVDRLPKADEDDLADEDADAGPSDQREVLRRAVRNKLRSWSSRKSKERHGRKSSSFQRGGASALRPEVHPSFSSPDALQRFMPKLALQLRVASTPPSYTLATVPIEHPDTARKDPGPPNEQQLAYWRTQQPLLSAQTPSRSQHLLPSILEHHAHSLAVAHEREAEWAKGDVQTARRARAARIKHLVNSAFSLANVGQIHKRSMTDVVGAMLASYGGGNSGGGDGADDGSMFARRTEFAQETGDDAQPAEDDEEDEDALAAKHEEELSALQGELEELTDELGRIEHASGANLATARLIESEIAAASEASEALADQHRVKANTIGLLPKAEANLARLREIADASAARILRLGEEWEAHRVPLIARYRRQKELIQDRKEEVRVKLEHIKRFRAEMKQLASDIRDKDAVYKRVLAEHNRLPKSINRQVYVRRIMDIVKNLDKQKKDIRKILEDIRNVQRDINSVAEKSKRSFSVADELVFRAASVSGGSRKKKDPQVTQAYKYLVFLRKGFDQLVQVVDDTGRIKNETRDMTAKVEALEARNTSLNMQSIKKDLAAVKKENEALATQLKQARS